MTTQQQINDLTFQNKSLKRENVKLKAMVRGYQDRVEGNKSKEPVISKGPAALRGTTLNIKTIDQINEHYKPGRVKEGRAILQFGLDGKFIREWHSINFAATSLKINRGNITTCATGAYKTSGGFVWRYKDDGGFRK